MENKYYIPSIEEFHVGFVYEQQEPDGWMFHVYGGGTPCLGYILPSKLNGELASKYLRIKCLDKEDIESLGWYSEQILDIWMEGSEFELGYSFDISDTSTAHLMYDKNFIARIYRADEYNQITGNWTEHKLFHGQIKNKSELKRLMLQIGIK